MPSTTLPTRMPSKETKLQPICLAPASTELRGLALQVTAGPNTPPRIQPSASAFKHSLFCEPPTSPDSTERSSPSIPQRRQARRLSSKPASLSERMPDNLQAGGEQDDVSPLPVSVDFGTGGKVHRSRSKRLRQPLVSTMPILPPYQPSQQIVPDCDQLSPLPEKSRFSPTSPKSSEFPVSRPLQPEESSRDVSSMSRTTHRSTTASPLNRSIFPQYDPARRLERQSYYPTHHAYAQALPSDKISKIGSPIEKQYSQRFDSAVSLSNDYEQVPCAVESDFLYLNSPSTGHLPHTGRKVQLGLYQPIGQGTSLLVGLSAEQPVFSLVRSDTAAPPQKGETVMCWGVEQTMTMTGIPQTLTQLEVDCAPLSRTKPGPGPTTIFPQTAASQAVRTAANSPEGLAIATFDPAAGSIEAARMAQDAVELAHQRYECRLVRTTRKRDSVGAVTAAYGLEHPMLGAMTVSVSKSYKSPTSREPRAKIAIHHPSATPAAIKAENLVLASLDFAHDACVIDLPALLALDSDYMIDTAISALFAVAAIENSMLQTEAVNFAPPPTAPFTSDKLSKKALKEAKKSARFSKRSSKVIDSISKELVGQPADVGRPVQGAVALIGFGLKTAIYVLEAGVRIGVRVVGHVGRK
ncbi:hypothetical protein LTR62_004011 [Meristemomyces frigidus]|uniref:Uncharacterized protein n=1 Tax=Meristemomyces frigidus TaxID=1508187 RepID=A0AAN7YTV8_9PEZI|nr:hypothetical protein LTR62_004011 [Meristemomyces frigidus]